MLYRCMSYVTWHVFFLYILPYALLCTLRTLCTLYSALQIICSILSAPYFIFYTVFYIICVYHIHYIFCVLRQCNNTMLCYTALHCATLHYSTLCYIILQYDLLGYSCAVLYCMVYDGSAIAYNALTVYYTMLCYANVTHYNITLCIMCYVALMLCYAMLRYSTLGQAILY